MNPFLLLLGLLSVASACGVVFSRNAVYSALCLTGNLVLMAVLFLSLSLQFLGAAQLLIYAGAIMVVFLFAVTVLAPDEEMGSWKDEVHLTGLVIGALVGAGLLATLTTVRLGPAGAVPSTIAAFSVELFGRYVFIFEATALILLVALIGAVLLGRRRTGRG